MVLPRLSAAAVPARRQALSERARRSRGWRATLVGVASGIALSASAATVTLHPNGRLVVLEGRISVGDYDKVEQLARQHAPTGIYLASPGGNLGEALRIGTLVRSLAWETIGAERPEMAPALSAGVAQSYGVRDTVRNNQCSSACFFIFVAGIHRDGHVLGIHEPYMSPTELERLQPEEASRRINSVKAVVEFYLRRMGVPGKYFEKMYDVPKERLHWINADDIATDFTGFIPSVRDWVRSECGDDFGTARCKEQVMLGIRLRALQNGGGGKASAGPPNEAVEPTAPAARP